MRLGEPLERIHSPVPHFKTHLQRTMDRMFSRLTPAKPHYRSNWLFTPNADLSPFAPSSDGSGGGVQGGYHFARRDEAESDSAELPVVSLGDATPNDLFVRVEYQSIIRLPVTRAIVFTLRTYIEPLSALSASPEAAEMLLLAVDGLTPERQEYLGMGDTAKRRSICEFLRQQARGGAGFRGL